MRPTIIAALGAVLLVLLIVGGTFFTVTQTQQALVLYFGEPVRVITAPGLKFKAPLVESVVLLDNRILDLETPQQEVLASDNQRILVDAFVRYKIADPLRFYQSVGTITRANNQLASVMNSALRRVLGESTLPQIVKEDRAALMVRIRDLVNQESSRIGLTISDVRIRRADLPTEISKTVFSRMISERAREAAEYRAQGSEQSQSITANADRQVVVLKAEAQRKADELRGQGDAERNRIFAEAYGKDPDFFAFYRSMQAYASALKPADTRMVLSPQSTFFRFFEDLKGAGPTAQTGGAP
jgi:modulator of FtsH protease HflC